MVVRRALLLALALAGVACSDPPPPSPSSCPQDLPASCPSQVPSYATDIVPLVEQRCFPCHTGTGAAGPNYNFSTYPGVFARRSSILNQVYACNMPPPDAGQPTTAERNALLAWLVCHAPQN